MSRVALGTALVAAAAALFGTLSYITRSADQLGLGALPFVFWRGAVGTVALLAVGLFIGRRLPTGRLSELLPPRRRALAIAALLGALLNIAMFLAFVRTTIAVALIVFYVFPALVTLAAVRFYGERLDRVRAGALVLSAIGLALVVLVPVLGSTDVNVDPVGVALALGAAVCQASFILITGRGFAPLSPVRVATFAVAAAGAMALVLALIAGDLAGLALPFSETRAWVWILVGGVTGAAIPTAFFVTGIGLIGPSRAAILMTIEPLVGVALAGLLLGEHPTPVQLVGGAAVLATATILQVAPRHGRVPEPELSPLV